MFPSRASRPRGGGGCRRICRTTAIVACWNLASLASDEGPLTVADLAAYRAALDPAAPGSPAAPSATFRDLWGHPSDFRGRRVEVGGRVERVFHQGAVGQFPALVEVWAVDAATDPLCLVLPEPGEGKSPRPGDSIRFEGTFLRRVRYRGGDVDRFAPLIVGPGPPRIGRAAPHEPPPGASGSPNDGVFVLVLGGIVLLMLLRAHLRRPVGTPIVEGPAPEFRDRPPAGYDDGVN